MQIDDNELALREHVRELLTNYIYTHLAIDYVQYSESSVSEILSRILKPIPYHGPGEIALSIDPFESLKQKLNLNSLTPYDEIWKPTPEAVQLLKKTYLAPKTRSKTETIWMEEDDFDFESMPHRPITPILSRSSRNKTPLATKPSKYDTKPRSLARSLSSYGIKPVEDEHLPKEEPMKLEDHLDLKLTIDAFTHSNMVEFQRQIPFLARPALRPLPFHAAEFLRTHSPDYEEKFTPFSPPIFAREYRSRPYEKEDESVIPGAIKFEPVEVPELDLNIATESMKVIEGWTTLPSHTSTPSLSSDTSEVDELHEDVGFWRPSSSDRTTSIEPLESVKIDPPIFPRGERPGTGKAGFTNKKHGQSLSSFISARIPLNSSTRILSSPKSDDVQPRPDTISTVSLSMLGQPPSDSDSSALAAGDSEGVTFSMDIQRILKIHGSGQELKSYRDIILDERLDDKGTMFMDVPKLPAPNAYLQDRVDSDTKPGLLSGRASERPSFRASFMLPTIFKKATGLKSLNLELSWRPFSFGSKIPTHTELIGVDSLFTDTGNSGRETPSQKSIKGYLSGSVFPVDSDDETSDPNPSFGLDKCILKDIQANDDFDILKAKYDLDRDFDEDNFLLCRSDRHGFGSQATNRSIGQLSANGPHPLNNPNSDETSDFSSAIAPEFDQQFSQTQHAVTLPFAYDVATHTSVDEFNYAYDGLEEYNDMETCRDRKKRRLAPDELDALCAMAAISQSATATINPKDLILPTSDDIPSHDFIPATTAVASTNAHQLISAPSQSQSLSLSLIEDSASQDGILVNATSNATDYASGDPMHSYEQNEAVAFLGNAAHSYRLFPRDYHQAFSCEVVPAQPGHCEEERADPVPRDSPAFSGDLCPGASHLPTPKNVQIYNQNDSQDTREDQESNKLGLPHLLSLSAVLAEKDNLSAFLMLRGKGNTQKAPLTIPEKPASFREEVTHAGPGNADGNPNVSALTTQTAQTYRFAPPELLTVTRAFSIPKPWQAPSIQHTYLISVDCVQQRALVHALESRLCAVRLLERETLSPPVPLPSDIPQTHSGEISIIVGPDSGVIFFPLSALPSEKANNSLLDALSAHSYRFFRILVVFVAFPRSQMLRVTDPVRRSENGLGMYSPAVLEKARRVRRNISVREGTGEKRASCRIELAFADDVDQAAMFVRAFGDLSLRDHDVDFTPYIGEEEQEGEHDLAELEGMNAFCSAIILQCCTLEEFLEMPPEQRTEGLTDLIGKERIEHVNAVLSKRMREMEVDSMYSPDIIPIA